MRLKHSWHVIAFFGAVSAACPAPAAPQRVVSAEVCTDEYVFRLLPRDRIAALSFLAADRHPVVSTIVDRVKGIPLVHDNAEEILSHHPDLVVTYQGVDQKLHALLQAAGVPVLDVPWANSVADVRKVTRMLGDALGARARAAAMLSAMDAKLAKARAAAPASPVRALVYEPNGYVTAGGVTEEMMAAGGLADAAVQIGVNRMGRIPVESVVAAAPALLILNGRQVPTSQADLVLHNPALSALKGKTAIRWASLTPLLCPGPWSADAALTFARLAAGARAP